MFLFFLKRLKFGKICFLYIFWFYEYLRYVIFYLWFVKYYDCIWDIINKNLIILCFCIFFEEIEIRKDKVFVYFLVSWIFEIFDIWDMFFEVLWWYLVYIFWFHEYLRYLIFQICFWSIMMVFSISLQKFGIFCVVVFFDEFEIWKDKVFE